MKGWKAGAFGVRYMCITSLEVESQVPTLPALNKEKRFCCLAPLLLLDLYFSASHPSESPLTRSRSIPYTHQTANSTQQDKMVNSNLQSTVQSSLDASTQDQKAGIHGIAFVAVNKKGEVLAEAASGTRTKDGSDKVDMETMFCTFFGPIPTEETEALT